MGTAPRVSSSSASTIASGTSGVGGATPAHGSSSGGSSAQRAGLSADARGRGAGCATGGGPAGGADPERGDGIRAAGRYQASRPSPPRPPFPAIAPQPGPAQLIPAGTPGRGDQPPRATHPFPVPGPPGQAKLDELVEPPVHGGPAVLAARDQLVDAARPGTQRLIDPQPGFGPVDKHIRHRPGFDARTPPAQRHRVGQPQPITVGLLVHPAGDQGHKRVGFGGQLA